MSRPEGLSTHEMVLEIRADLKQHIKDSQTTELHITRELGSRPTRSEVIKWAGGLSGLAVLAGFLS